MLGQGLPGAVTFYEDGKDRVEYLRFGDRGGIEPLVIDRSSTGSDRITWSSARNSDSSIACTTIANRIITSKIDDDGNELSSQLSRQNRIQVRLRELRQFLAIKEMHLAIVFDCREHSASTLKELGLEKLDPIREIACLAGSFTTSTWEASAATTRTVSWSESD